VSPQPISADAREFLGRLRDLLLEQHKLLLDLERAVYEKANGPIPGPGAFLKLVIGDPHFGWLKQISTLVVEIDEALAPRSTADQSAADSLTAQAHEFMRISSHGGDFHVRYAAAVRASEAVSSVQARIAQLLGS